MWVMFSIVYVCMSFCVFLYPLVALYSSRMHSVVTQATRIDKTAAQRPRNVGHYLTHNLTRPIQTENKYR